MKSNPIINSTTTAARTNTAADIVHVVNHVFKSNPLAVPHCAADVDYGSGVTGGDIIYLVAHVFRGGAALTASCGPEGSIYWPLAEA